MQLKGLVSCLQKTDISAFGPAIKVLLYVVIKCPEVLIRLEEINFNPIKNIKHILHALK